MYNRNFKEMDISNNPFELPKPVQFDHIAKYIEKFGMEIQQPLDIKPLSHLALHSVMDNRLPFKRQDIPRSLWTYFEVVGACMLCHKWILPNSCQIAHIFGLPSAEKIIRDYKINSIPWQSLLCQNENFCERR